MRRGHVLGALVALHLLLPACTSGEEAAPPTEPPTSTQPTTATTTPTTTAPTTVASTAPASVREWRPMAASPLRGRSDVASVWTGREVIVVGGQRQDVAGPGDRVDATRSGGNGEVPLTVTRFDDGAAYDPAADRWRPIARAPATPVGDAMWTGRVVLVRGARSVQRAERSDALVLSYDPSSDRWTSFPAPPGTNDPFAVVAAWTGTELVVWGRPGYQEQAITYAFDPATGAWRELPPGPLPGYFSPAAIWTGREVLVLSDVPSVSGPLPLRTMQAATLDPATGEWRTRAPVPLDRARPGLDTVLQLTDDRIVLAGGSDAPVPNRTVLAWDPDTDTWSALGTFPIDPRQSSGYVWTGDAMLEIGGVSPGPNGTGYWNPMVAAAQPPASFRTVSVVGTSATSTVLPELPVGLAPAVVAWTGTSLIVWGGLTPQDGPDATTADGWTLTP